jgi:hypothetical protein
MTDEIAELAVLDPIGAITRLVAEVEPALATDLIRDIVSGVAGGRAKCRRLAQALVERCLGRHDHALHPRASHPRRRHVDRRAAARR